MYRHYVVSRLKNLEMLDDQSVTEEERADAMKIYGNLDNTVAAQVYKNSSKVHRSAHTLK